MPNRRDHARPRRGLPRHQDRLVCQHDATLDRHGHPDVEILVTVSPVPLDATFTGTDIVMATTYSKSLLRSAAGEWSQSKRNVHYFPSYEIVMNSARDRAWFMDGRHVRQDMVAHIMQTFANAYAPHPALGGQRTG
ncbi:MAG: hypothetical protein E6I00_10585 [Chloroflexi bacterium]|nr:MAG: hypothetical protein E6I00_10585 [Chloroflexota bacterium]